MNKAEYLEHHDVVCFATWLGANLDNGTLAHRWVDRRSDTRWSCASVYDAFLKYQWRFFTSPGHGGSSFAANADALDSLQDALSNAVTDQEALNAAIGVMLWGGVGPGNIRWLQANVTGLLALLRSTAHALASNNLADPILTARTLRFTSGMSKVYSLLVPEMIIYDSRVAAALARAVSVYCANRLDQVPEELRFPVAPAKQAPSMVNPKCRDPSTGQLRFPALVPGPAHAAWNLKASWVLEKALSIAGTGSQFNDTKSSGGNALRALEAALFMIGYDLPGCCAGDTLPPAPKAKTPLGSIPSDRLQITCYTLARKTQFDYSLSSAGLHIDGQPSYDTQILQRLVDALAQSFGAKPFPLANARDQVAEGRAAAGFGTTFTKITGRTSQAASRVAAVLVDIGILSLVGESPVFLSLVPSHAHKLDLSDFAD